MRFSAAIAASILACLALAPVPAEAACFEDIGCTDGQKYRQSDLRRLSCQNLWFVRNTIYHENGYCFKTRRAIREFGNAGCRYDDVGEVPLNFFERYNAGAIKKAERRKGC
jgi:YARHG domain